MVGLMLVPLLSKGADAIDSVTATSNNTYDASLPDQSDLVYWTATCHDGDNTTLYAWITLWNSSDNSAYTQQYSNYTYTLPNGTSTKLYESATLTPGYWRGSVICGDGIQNATMVNATYIFVATERNAAPYPSWTTATFMSYSSQKHSFYAYNKTWLFYMNTSDITWAYSSDYGLTWTNSSVLIGTPPGGKSSDYFDIWFNNTTSKVSVAWLKSTANDGDIFYREGTVNSDGTITWDAPVTAYNSAKTSTGITLIRDSDGYPWISYTNSSNYMVALKASTTNGSAWNAPTQLENYGANTYGALAPMTNGKVMAVYWIAGNKIKSKLYNGSAWQTTANIVSNNMYNAYARVAVRSYNDYVYVVWLNTTTIWLRLSEYNGSAWEYSNASAVNISSVAIVQPFAAYSITNNSLFITSFATSIRGVFYWTWNNSALSTANTLAWFYELNSDTSCMSWDDYNGNITYIWTSPEGLNMKYSPGPPGVAPDTTPPQYSNLVSNPATPATYAPSQQYQFNSTWTDNIAMDSAILNFSTTNYTASNSGSVYYQNISDLAAGNYSYIWYANDSSNNWNNTGTQNFTINQASTTTNLYLNDSEANNTITYGNHSNASAITSAVSVTIYRDSNPVANPEIAILAVGTYNYTAINVGNTNYTGSSANWNLTVDQALATLSLTADPAWSNLNGTTTNVSCSANNAESIYTLYRNTTPVANPDVQTLGRGYYFYNCSAPATQNYTADEVTEWMNITNNLPVTTSVVITPNPAYVTTDLTCTVASSDADGDPLTYFQLWYRNGILNLSMSSMSNTSILGMGNLSKGIEWNCTGYATDGINDSNVMSDNITISNSPPVISSVVITPPLPTTLDDLNCTATASDADNDTISYLFSWYRNGILTFLENTLANTSLLTSGNTTVGDNWNCSVMANDGTDNSTIVSDNVTIVNSAPSIPNYIYPDNGTVFASIASTYLNWTDSTDADADPITYYINFSTSTPPTYNSSTANNYTTMPVEPNIYYWTITAGDGTTNSSNTTVWQFEINAQPIVSYTNITPIAPYTTDDLLFYANCTDANNATMTMYLTDVFKDNVSQGITNSSTVTNDTSELIYVLSNGITNRSEQWLFEVVCGDNIENSTAVNSSFVTILNSPPTIPSYNSPADGTNATSPVTLNWTTSTDADNDTITYYINYSTVSPPAYNSSTTSTTKSLNATLASTYYWTITAGDGTDNSSNTTIWSFLTNYTNVYPNVSATVVPAGPKTADDLKHYITCIDEDADSLTAYTTGIFKNDVSQGFTNSSSVINDTSTKVYALSHLLTAKGENWTFEARCYDGHDYSNYTNVTVTIGNTAPTLTSLYFIPASPIDTDNLYAYMKCTDPDAADTITAWVNDIFKDNVSQGLSNSSIVTSGIAGLIYTVGAGLTTVGEQWHFEGVCGDGTDNSTTSNSTAVTIYNVSTTTPVGITIPMTASGYPYVIIGEGLY
jgi:hypothetical protein